MQLQEQNLTKLFCCAYTRLTIIEWERPGLNSRPGLYFLKDMINSGPLNKTDFYSEEASIQGNTVHELC